ncbi:MAG: DUF305 domain-containing protein [Methylobacterium mesophilicum]|nr:DUF305 domain-containing protein [Methylobacterium mesophilicum]
MKRRILILSALLLAASPAFAQDDQPAMDHSQMSGSGMKGASVEYMEAMKRMDQSMTAMQMTGKPGMDFAAMMIPHHQAAIAMAKSYIESGDNDPELVKMANEIVTAQEREIAMLNAWIAKNK